MRPAAPDWTPQRAWEIQRPWGWGRAIDQWRLRRAIWLECETIASTQFVVTVPGALRDPAGALVNFHPRRPLEAPPCGCAVWAAAFLCEHVLCVLLHVGDREVVQALRRLVPAVEGGG